ncbi:MAG: o-succinylbenzoate synthase [Acidobacteriota bacterium]
MDMIPEKIELFRVPVDLPAGWRSGLGAADSVRSGLLVAVSQDGVTGWGECVAGEAPFFSHETVDSAWRVIVRHLAPGLCGRVMAHPARITDLPHIRRVRGQPMATAALETALWDLHARRQGAPLAALIGGSRQRVAAGVSLGIASAIPAFLDGVERHVRAGYRRIKCKIAPGWDVEPLQAVRRRFPDLALTVDANGAYDRRDASVFAALDALDLAMIEQPLAPDDLVGHAQLQARLETPIALDESITSFATAETAAALGACRIVNLKVGRLGGLGTVLALHEARQRLGFRLFVGGMFETEIGRCLNVQIASLPGIDLPGDIPARVGGSSTARRALAEPALELCPHTGTVAVPDAAIVHLDRVQQIATRYRCITAATRSSAAWAAGSAETRSSASNEVVDGVVPGRARDDPRPDPQRAIIPRRSYLALHEAVFRMAVRHPDRVAVRKGDDVLRYGPLRRRSLQLATALNRRGLTGASIGLVVGRGLALVQGILGIARAGASFTVVEGTLPRDFAADLCRRAGVALLLHDDARRSVAEDLAARLDRPCVDLTTLARDDVDADDDDASADRLPPVQPDAPAYAVFTSGTTGRPKGIVTSHEPVTHFLDWQRRRFGLAATDRFSLLSGLSHDILLRDVLAPLSVGAVLVIPPHDDILVRGLAGWLRDERITVTHLTPARGALIAADGVHLPDLRRVFFGGDRLSAQVTRAFEDLAPAAALVNFYGTSETPQAVAWREVDASVAAVDPIPIGRGIDAVQILVLDDTRRLAAVGEAGEIAVRTPYLSQGYVDDARANHRAFIANPFTGDARDRVFLTGDLGRFGARGDVEILGRIDRQLKIRGVRLEPAGIEARLMTIPGIRQALVTAVGDGDQRRLAAFLVREPEARDRSHRAMRNRVRRHLASRFDLAHMPAHLAFIERIPLTANGKIDFSALPVFDDAMSRRRAAHSPLETFILATWQRVLGVAVVHADDDFFALGGHSLSALQVLAEVRAAYAVDLPLQALMFAPTPAALARAVADALSRGPTPDGGRPQLIVREDRSETETFPLSYAQARLLDWEHGNRHRRSPRLWLTLALVGRVDSDRLVRSFDRLVERHPMLRARLVAGDDGVLRQRLASRQEVAADGPILRFVECADAQRESPESALWEMLQPWNVKDFAPGDALVRAMLIRQQPEIHYLSLQFHHAVVDAHARRQLMREWSDLAAGQPVAGAGPPPHFADYVDAQRHRPAPSPQRLRAWQRRHADLPGPPVAYDHAPADRPDIAAHSQRSCLAPETVAALRDLARRCGTTEFAVLLAALAQVLRQESGASDVVIGVPFTDRGTPETAEIVGYCVNVLLVRIDLEDADPFREVVQRTWAALREATAHGHEPLGWWVEHAAAANGGDVVAPYSSVYCNMIHLQEEILHLDGVEVTRLEHPDHDRNRFAVNDVNLLLRPVYPSDRARHPAWQPGGLVAEWRLRSDRYRAATAQRLARRFRALCRGVGRGS